MLVLKPHKKRVYYRAGLISLILLPILCLWYITKHAPYEEGVIEITPWNPNFLKFKFGPNWMRTKTHPDRKYVDFSLTGNTDADKIKLDKAQLEIKKVVHSMDTIQGVHFYFGDDARYWELIQIYDICDTEHALCYQQYENDFYVWNPEPPKPIKGNYTLPPCGGILMNDVVIVVTDSTLQREAEEKRQKKIRYVVDITKIFWPSEVLFGLMLVLTIKGLRKYPT